MVVVRKCFALFQIKFVVCYQAALKYAVKQICVVNLNGIGLWIVKNFNPISVDIFLGHPLLCLAQDVDCSFVAQCVYVKKFSPVTFSTE